MPAGMLVTEVEVAAETVAAVAAVVAPPPCGGRRDELPVIVSNAPFIAPGRVAALLGVSFLTPRAAAPSHHQSSQVRAWSVHKKPHCGSGFSFAHGASYRSLPPTRPESKPRSASVSSSLRESSRAYSIGLKAARYMGAGGNCQARRPPPPPKCKQSAAASAVAVARHGRNGGLLILRWFAPEWAGWKSSVYSQARADAGHVRSSEDGQRNCVDWLRITAARHMSRVQLVRRARDSTLPAPVPGPRDTRRAYRLEREHDRATGEARNVPAPVQHGRKAALGVESCLSTSCQG